MGKAIVVKGVDFSALNVGKVKLMSSDVIVVESIHIANKAASLLREQQLFVTYLPVNTNQIGVTWKSSDNSVATVTSSGKVIVKKTGTVVISASSTYDRTVSDSFQASCTTDVDYVPVTSLELSQAAVEGYEGDATQLVCTALPTNATLKEVVWSSSDPTVCRVTRSGVVSLQNSGVATITVTSESEPNVQKQIQVKVQKFVPESYPVEGMILRLKSFGKQNADADAAVWSDKSGNGNNFILKGFAFDDETGWNNGLRFGGSTCLCENDSMPAGGISADKGFSLFMKINAYSYNGVYFSSEGKQFNNSNIKLYNNANKLVLMAGPEKVVELALNNYFNTDIVVGVILNGDSVRIFHNKNTADGTSAFVRDTTQVYTTIGSSFQYGYDRVVNVAPAVIKDVIAYNRAVTDEEFNNIINGLLS
ncbi:hypothetical protein HMPREF1067_01869 [Bacteroides fragilis CL03T12C07]|uniref:Ig-like domain-containing protein n=1 Tax=Bacteroides fragilis TaxID=817 RepID=UPI000269416D|nr:Ig-like domain-containing protein [Bacteroides fragilis]DAP75997.1 MAG TPA: Tail tube protein [Caudoviricetes sp.]EIY45588.1 hypothetical protein HMPREF1066_02994 [Bacteroides fragilis CL03T00C08]EIY48500.1 hypothetical protein HMPREF1067_01869 [Bacteroides fragilis CL03T12C07]MCE8792443.1 Ig-like domain-containing protein [Bacteroides fragilis]MCS2807310.1 Ig-like domain-containing protein [Bacteroides fragilis]